MDEAVTAYEINAPSVANEDAAPWKPRQMASAPSAPHDTDDADMRWTSSTTERWPLAGVIAMARSVALVGRDRRRCQTSRGLFQGIN